MAKPEDSPYGVEKDDEDDEPMPDLIPIKPEDIPRLFGQESSSSSSQAPGAYASPNAAELAIQPLIPDESWNQQLQTFAAETEQFRKDTERHFPSSSSGVPKPSKSAKPLADWEVALIAFAEEEMEKAPSSSKRAKTSPPVSPTAGGQLEAKASESSEDEQIQIGCLLYTSPSPRDS